MVINWSEGHFQDSTFLYFTKPWGPRGYCTNVLKHMMFWGRERKLFSTKSQYVFLFIRLL